MAINMKSLKYILCLVLIIPLLTQCICFGNENNIQNSKSKTTKIERDTYKKALPKLVRMLKSNKKEKILNGLNIARKLNGKLQGNKEVLKLITTLVESNKKHISIAATAVLYYIGDKSSLKDFIHFRSSPILLRRFYGALGILEISSATTKQASKAIDTILDIVTDTNLDTRRHREIIWASLNKLKAISKKANIEQPTWNKQLPNKRTKNKEELKSKWESYVLKLNHWWKKHQEEIVKKMYGKKKDKKKVKDKDKEHKQKQGSDNQKNQQSNDSSQPSTSNGT